MKVPLPPQKRLMQVVSVTVSYIFLLIIPVVAAAVVLASLNDARKPAVYLYPIEDMDIQVEVDVNGFIYNDIPDYNNGINTIVDNLWYRYLFLVFHIFSG